MKNILIHIMLFFSFLANTLIAQDTEKIAWNSFEDAVLIHSKSPKKVFIDVYTDWCGWCKVYDKSTFPDTTIVRLMNKYFIPVKLNAERKDTVVFQGYSFVNPNPTVSRSPHQLAGSLLKGRMSYPTICFLDDSMRLITIVASYLKPPELEPILEYIGSDKYLTMTYDSFKLSYKTISGTPAVTEQTSLGTTTTYIPDKLAFESGKSEINAEAYSQLDGVVELMKKTPSVKIEIGGHTDSTAAEISNVNLSGYRAKAVYDYFLSKGVDSSRMSYSGYGSSKPFVDNRTEEGMRKNRRVEIKIIQ